MSIAQTDIQITYDTAKALESLFGEIARLSTPNSPVDAESPVANPHWQAGNTMDMSPPNVDATVVKRSMSECERDLGKRCWDVLGRMFPGESLEAVEKTLDAGHKFVIYNPAVDEFHLVPVGTGINQKLAKLTADNKELRDKFSQLLYRIATANYELATDIGALREKTGDYLERISGGGTELLQVVDWLESQER